MRQGLRHRMCWNSAFGRPGGDLLSHALRRSTIGAEGLYGRVRNGIGCGALAITTRSSKRAEQSKNAVGRPTGFEISNSAGCTTRNALSLPLHMTAAIKPIERLVPVSFMRYRTSTPGLSTWWSSTALKGELVLREASRLDAFSGYPVRT
jgi:hypothetical protein